LRELQVPTRRVPVEIFLRTGGHLEGVLFLVDTPLHARPPWEVLEVLNDDRRFLPVLAQGPESERFVLNKEHILRVRLRSPESRTGEDPAWVGLEELEPPDASTFHLSDGQLLRGQLCLDTRPNASRPLDKLNQARTFIAVHCADGVEFVRTSAVVRVD
jgi:hypothetical protein